MTPPPATTVEVDVLQPLEVTMARDDDVRTQTSPPARRSALRYWVTLESPMWFILVIIFVMGLLIGLLRLRRS
ncbi:DUF1049 domain-containing protein [Mycobacterium sp. 21AC1]|uniref:DUF1049 domain-containing protein n=1 Tax=[Mycobacterium] appelbergii TaxID=2939269 RepID=UPI002939465A|nr:DUF1049 domain-containing protein [Mycobacterium sp. 21AC1]MDV3128026.1 DUF1049 domain-containing protein [Mycobacterium sp. 21AC1]